MGTQCYILWLLMVRSQSIITLSSYRQYFLFRCSYLSQILNIFIQVFRAIWTLFLIALSEQLERKIERDSKRDRFSGGGDDRQLIKSTLYLEPARKEREGGMGKAYVQCSDALLNETTYSHLKASCNNVQSEIHGPTCYHLSVYCDIEARKNIEAPK